MDSGAVRKRLLIVAGVILTLGLGIFGGMRCRYGGGERFAFEAPAPADAAPKLESIVELPTPPGNIAVADDGSLFFTFHPDAHPPYPLAELVDGEAEPFRGADAVDWDAPLAVRIGPDGHLWVLDTGLHAVSPPRLFAFDLETREVVHEHSFGGELAPLGSHYNDFRFNREGTHLVIADPSIMRKTPALIVYELASGTARRVLESHASLQAGDFLITIDGEAVTRLGIFSLRPGVDSIAYDAAKDELVFSAITGTQLHRLAMSVLIDPSKDEAALAAAIRSGPRKPVTDGMVADAKGRVYTADIQAHGLVRFEGDELTTLLRDERLQWLDGLDLGADGALYLTDSALHRVILASESKVREMGPYSIFKLLPPAD